MKKKFLCLGALLGGVFFIQACSSSGSETSLKDELEKVAGQSEKNASGGNKCLLGYAEKLDGLLTVELAKEVADFSPEEADFEYSKVMKDPYYHSVSYAWKGGRTRKIDVGLNGIVVPDQDRVAVNGIRATTFETFKRDRRNVTDEELAEMNRQIDKALSGESDNEAVNKRLEKLEKMGVDKKAVQSAGSSIGGMAGKVSQSYSEVSGLGEAAAWNSVEERLYVFHEGVEFSVAVKTSDDEEVNKQKSVSLAEKILKQCP